MIAMMPPEPESTESVISRICRALSWADGFALYFVLVNLPSARRAISLQVIEQLDRPVIELDVPSEGFGDTTLDGWLPPKLEELEDVPSESPIFLHNLDNAMPSGRVELRRFLQQLNWRRSALAAVGRPLVIWLPRYALDNLAEHAPDFYDWYSNVYEFASPKEEAEELRSGFYTEFNTAVHPASRQSKAEKKQWLHTLTALLDEYPKRNAYRAKLLNEAGELHYASGNLEDALELYQQLLTINQENNNRKGEGEALNNIGGIHWSQGDYDKSLSYLEQSLTIRREIGDRVGEGTTLNNIGTLHHARGDYATALKYLGQSLSIRREIDDRAGEGATLNNIGQIYDAKGDYGKALEYLGQSFAIRREIGDRAGEGTTLNNLATTAYAKGDYDKALRYLEQSLAIRQEIGDRRGEDNSLHNIGGIYRAWGNNSKALQYYERALTIQQEIGDRYGEAVTSWNIGRLYEDQGDLAKAEKAISRAVQLAEAIGHPKLDEWRKGLERVRAAIRGR